MNAQEYTQKTTIGELEIGQVFKKNGKLFKKILVKKWLGMAKCNGILTGKDYRHANASYLLDLTNTVQVKPATA